MNSALHILATGRALPSRRVSNDQMASLVDTSDEWIATRTGIRQRYFCAEGERRHPGGPGGGDRPGAQRH